MHGVSELELEAAYCIIHQERKAREIQFCSRTTLRWGCSDKQTSLRLTSSACHMLLTSDEEHGKIVYRKVLHCSVLSGIAQKM
jgi:hypothetical protein